MTALDEQIGGSHYKDMVIQPWIFNIMNGIPSTEAHIIEYICRWKKKGGILDLQKIQQYCQMLIDHEELLNDLKELSCNKCSKKHALIRFFGGVNSSCECECHKQSSDDYAKDFMDRVKKSINYTTEDCENCILRNQHSLECECKCHKETKHA